MHDTRHIAQLLQKSIAGTLSPAEYAELRDWAEGDSVYQSLFDRVHDSHSLQELLLMRHEMERHNNKDYAEQLQETLDARITASRSVHKPSRLRRWLSYAAALLVISIAATWIFFETELSQQPKTVDLQSEDIQPGGNRAMLTLADGRTIDLSEMQKGIIVGDEITYQDGTSVLEQGTRIKEQVDRSGTAKENRSADYYVLNTPKGGTYQVILPDGTRVWLNSASTLKYPSHFDDDERAVELIGEAYFDVTTAAETSEGAKKQVWPFRVASSGQVVEVLGTTFNIAAYTDEQETRTTLVAGSVRILPLADLGLPITIKPGEQAINRAGSMTVKKVDPAQFTAWKDGFFYFDGLAPNMAFDQLERWYDIEIAYQGNIPSLLFFGMIDRSKPLSAILKTLAKSGLKFSVEKADGKSKLTILDE
jgi:transmembrane sensor